MLHQVLEYKCLVVPEHQQDLRVHLVLHRQLEQVWKSLYRLIKFEVYLHHDALLLLKLLQSQNLLKKTDHQRNQPQDL